MRDWTARHPEQTELHYLPGYSPEHNPAECLNQDVKSNALGRRHPRNLAQLVSEVRTYLCSRQRQPRNRHPLLPRETRHTRSRSRVTRLHRPLLTRPP